MKCLFVGGPADGEWIETEGQNYFEVSHIEPQPFQPKLLHERVTAVKVLYSMMPIRCGQTQFTIYRIEGMSDGAVFSMLLRGYRA